MQRIKVENKGSISHILAKNSKDFCILDVLRNSCLFSSSNICLLKSRIRNHHHHPQFGQQLANTINRAPKSITNVQLKSIYLSVDLKPNKHFVCVTRTYDLHVMCFLRYPFYFQRLSHINKVIKLIHANANT